MRFWPASFAARGPLLLGCARACLSVSFATVVTSTGDDVPRRRVRAHLVARRLVWVSVPKVLKRERARLQGFWSVRRVRVQRRGCDRGR